jgi:hypothetical protein
MSTDAQNNPAEPPKPEMSQKKGGPGRPKGGAYSKATAAEIERRVEFIYVCMAKGMRKYALKQAYHQQFGKMSARQIENYISRAKQLILKNSQKPLPEIRADSLAFYESISLSAKSEMARIRARERIDSIAGIDAPRRQELSGPAGGPVATTVEDKTPVPTLSKARLNEILAALEAGGNGSNGNGTNGNGHHGGNGEVNRVESLPA